MFSFVDTYFTITKNTLGSSPQLICWFIKIATQVTRGKGSSVLDVTFFSSSSNSLVFTKSRVTFSEIVSIAVMTVLYDSGSPISK
ncbi:unnamed protein product [Arctia plantaginis]|uniref:Uncharacterized protein n=1 Tax=Arctia plantaginis TaxID=874455 RepID=A0A8S0YTX7_ARCPL|nr:unnamed protein product [Arctia plantaginis]